MATALRSLLVGGLRRASSLALSSARPLAASVRPLAAANNRPAALSCSWPPPASVSGLQHWGVLTPEPSPRTAPPSQPRGLLGLALELSDAQPVSGEMLAKAGPPRRTKEQWLHIKRTKKFVK